MEPTTLSFEDFWKWLLEHHNCILRAGTPDMILYDEEDFHWHLTGNWAENRVVQVVRGKRLLGELVVEPDRVTYVVVVPGEIEGEGVFELISETPQERVALYFFILAHGYEENEETPRPVH